MQVLSFVIGISRLWIFDITSHHHYYYQLNYYYHIPRPVPLEQGQLGTRHTTVALNKSDNFPWISDLPPGSALLTTMSVPCLLDTCILSANNNIFITIVTALPAKYLRGSQEVLRPCGLYCNYYLSSSRTVWLQKDSVVFILMVTNRNVLSKDSQFNTS